MARPARKEKPRGRWFAGRGGPVQSTVWPSPEQELLLRCALFEGAEGLSAWRRWCSDVGLGRVDPGSAQLLPLVYRNLVDQGVQDGGLVALKSAYTITWAQNQRVFRRLAATLRLFHSIRVEALVLKGAALIPLYYRDGGMRGMGDFDVLVRMDRFSEAAQALVEAGWRPLSRSPERFDPRFDHALAFMDSAGNSVDLHCHLLRMCCEPGADDPFWEASIPLEIEGLSARTLCATDHLLQACVHGLDWVRVPPIRWVADAITVLRAAPREIDWDRVVDLARDRGLALPLSMALRYLTDTFRAAVPGTALRSLEDLHVSWSDRVQFGAEMESFRGRPLALVFHHYAVYSRGLRGTDLTKRVQAIPGYLRFWAQTDRTWKIPFRLVGNGLRVLGYRLGLYRYWDA